MRILSTVVVHPAVEDWTPASAQRAQDILAIGRLDWGGHVKNQDALVEGIRGHLRSASQGVPVGAMPCTFPTQRSPTS